MVKQDGPITRKALYEAVWSLPVEKVAEQYGLSGRGLGKLCERHGIPVPPRGYWAKQASGKRVVRPPLIELAQGPNSDPVIKIWGQRQQAATSSPDVSIKDAYVELWRSLLAETPEIKVPQRMSKPHPLVQVLIESDRRSAESYKWLSNYTPSKDPFEPKRRPILHAIFSALQERGMRVDFDQPRNVQFVAFAGQEKTIFRVEEWLQQNRRQLTSEERAKSMFANQKWTQTRMPSGKVTLRIKSWMPKGIPEVWRDDGSKALGVIVAEFVAAIVVNGECEKAKRVQRAEEDRRNYDAMMERERQERVAKELQARKNRIGDEAKLWQQAALIRDFVDAVRSAAMSAPQGSDADALDRWTRFALDYADEIDPLKSAARSSRILKL